jgi:predicted DNA-binding transcriptional regulator YafY
MAGRKAFERYLWFHRRLRGNRYPTLVQLMEKWEISRRQAQREIEHMRDFFGAPIGYCRLNRGYHYTEPGFELPASWIGEEEIIALVLAKRLATTIPDPETKRSLNRLVEKIEGQFELTIGELEKKVSLKNVCYYKVAAPIFHEVLFALLQGCQLQITYRSVFKAEESSRRIHPLHLVLYMGNWHLVAFCEAKQDIRLFALSRIQSAETLTDQPVPVRLQGIDIKSRLEKTHGIFFPKKAKRVRLKFSRAFAAFAREQVFYPGQQTKETRDGGLILEFPVADFPEVVREILSFGPEVAVLQPAALRDIVRERIKAMQAVYKK